MKQILYGVGKSVLQDFADPTSIVALSKLKDLTVNFSGEEEPVTGGDSPYPIAYFPKNKEITVTATNSLFSMKTVNVTQGANITIGAVSMTEFIEGTIPADGILSLGDNTPVVSTTIIDGYTEVSDALSLETGKFFVDISGKAVKFDEVDAGKEIEGVYKRTSAATAQTITVYKETLAKPFIFTHRIPVYDDNNAIVAQGQLIIYKAKANNNFEFGLAPQTAFAPKLELKAVDARRADGKLWDFTMEEVSASVPTPPTTYSVEFTVSDSVGVVAGATVAFNGNVVETNVSGVATFTGVLVGTNKPYSIIAAGYTTVNSSVTVNSNEAVSVTIVEIA